MNRIIKGDRVRIISGKHKGLEGVVLQVFPKDQTAIVEGLNLVTKHIKANDESEKGGIKKVESPIRLCKLALIDPKAKGASTKVIYQIDPKTNKKSRITKKSKTNLADKK